MLTCNVFVNLKNNQVSSFKRILGRKHRRISSQGILPISLIHLAWCLQELLGTSGVQSQLLTKAVNALHISSVFLEYLIENAKSNINEELYLSMDDSEALPDSFPRGKGQGGEHGKYMLSVKVILGATLEKINLMRHSIALCRGPMIVSLAALYDNASHVLPSHSEA